MEFVLVLWTGRKPETVTVLPESDIRINDKGKCQAKFGSRWYNVKILQKSVDKKWLESLDVLTDGTLYQPIPNLEGLSITSNCKLAEEKIVQQDQKVLENPVDVITALRDLDDGHQPLGLKDEQKIISADEYKNDKSAYDDDDDGARGLSTQNIEEDLAEDQRPDRTENFIKNQDGDDQNGNATKLVTQVELVKGRGVWIDKIDLEDIVDESSKPSDLTRNLLKHLIGVEKLKTMSVSGKNNWEPIPQPILKSVKSFVKKYARGDEMKSFNRWVTKYCNRLRSENN